MSQMSPNWLNIIALFKLQLATVENPAGRGVYSASNRYRSARIAQISQCRCSNYTVVSSATLVPEKVLLHSLLIVLNS